jgi:hypothetical protein
VRAKGVAFKNSDTAMSIHEWQEQIFLHQHLTPTKKC